MSARKYTSYPSPQAQTPVQANVTVHSRETRLALTPNSVVMHKGGIEFRSLSPFAQWTEMTVSLQSLPDDRKLHCHGVVVACTGSKHTGYRVSMLFTSLSKQAQDQLSAMARIS